MPNVRPRHTARGTVAGVVALAMAAASATSLAAQVVRDPPVPYHDPRYDDLPAPMGDVTDRLKHRALGGGVTASVGGEIRERYDRYADPGFGLGGVSHQAAGLSRVLLQADVHASDRVRAFVQLGSEAATRPRGAALPTDVDRFDLAQGFVDVTGRFAGGGVAVRAGRQELAFGAGRLVSVRESPNVRQSFDGGRVTWRRGARTADLLATAPVGIHPGVFDDHAVSGQRLWGAYVTAPVVPLPGAHLDVYYLGNVRPGAAYGRDTARSVRHTPGLRLWRALGPVDYDAEATGQLGRFGTRSVRAGALAADVGYTAARAPWRPRLGVRLNAASGDAGGHGRGTFDPLFPKYALFSEAQLTEFMNVESVFPSLTLAPTRRLAFTAGLDALWRQTTHDAVYLAPLTPVPGTVGRPGRYTGTQTSVQGEWLVGPHLDLNVAWARHGAGPALRAVGGRRVEYVGTWVSVKL